MAHILWKPPTGTDIEMQRCGVVWDAVKVPERTGDIALLHLGAQSGAVIHDPWSRVLYWLTSPGQAHSWRIPGVTVLGDTCHVSVPSTNRTQGPGPHWVIRVSADRYLTQTHPLYEALTVATSATL